MPGLCNRRGQMRWRAKVEIAGLPVKTKWFGNGPMGGKEYKAAVAWEEATRRELEARRKQEASRPTSSASLPLVTWTNAYLADQVQAGRVRRTINEKCLALRRLALYLAEEAGVKPDALASYAVTDLDADVAEGFMDWAAARFGGGPANAARKNIGAAWEFGRMRMRRLGFPTNMGNPFHEAGRRVGDRRPRYVPHEDDFWRVVALHRPFEALDAANMLDVAEGQDRLMLLAYFGLGARRAEVFRLRVDDVSWSNNAVRLGTHKTRDGGMRYDWLPMTDDLRAGLRWWLAHRPWPRKSLFYCLNVGAEAAGHNIHLGEPFRSRQHWMRRLCEAAEVPPFGLHAIRHLAAVRLYKAGNPLAKIQMFLRHRSAGVTERYLSSLGCDVGQLGQAVEALSGRGGNVIPFPGAGWRGEKESAASGAIANG